MRNQQIKKVNRIFFSGQDEEKRKWIEQMATEGWQLISVNSGVYSFQRVAPAKNENISSYKSILGKDFQRSRPLYQESNQNGVALLPERNIDHINSTSSLLPALVDGKYNNITKKRRYQAGTFAIILLLIAISTKVTLVSTGDFLSLFKLHFLTGILFIGLCLALTGTVILKSLLNFLSAECKPKE